MKPFVNAMGSDGVIRCPVCPQITQDIFVMKAIWYHSKTGPQIDQIPSLDTVAISM